MPTSLRNGFGITNMDIEPLDRAPNISNDVNQTLARIMGFDYTASLWRGLAADIDGRLVISMSGVQVNQAVSGFVAPAGVAFNLRPANPNRRYLVLYNNSALLAYLGFTAAVSAANGFPFSAGTVYTDNIYTGEYWCFMPLPGGDIRFLEF